MTNMKVPKSKLFKWIGGKKWMSSYLSEAATISFEDNPKIDTYVEPFLGGMGAFFALYPLIVSKNIKNIVLNDINVTLISTFNFVKSNPSQLIKEFTLLDNSLEALMPASVTKNGVSVALSSLHGVDDKELIKESLDSAKTFYNDTRTLFNKDKKNDIPDIKNSARFLFLMAHCFNGIYRENSSGGYNVPFNWAHNTPNTKAKIDAINDYNKFFNSNNIIFENMDVFSLISKYGKENCFYYMDPPYMNEKTSENKYSEGGFGSNEQSKLVSEAISMDSMVYSNHYLKSIKDEFAINNIDFKKIFRKNIMAASAEARKNDLAEILAWK